MAKQHLIMILIEDDDITQNQLEGCARSLCGNIEWTTASKTYFELPNVQDADGEQAIDIVGDNIADMQDELSAE